MASRLHTTYRKKVAPALRTELKLDNAMAAPTVSKIVLNVGFGKHTKDAQYQPTVIKTLERVSGQKPVVTKAKKSIASFKLRTGMPVGAKVTLRGERMWEFLDKFINVTLARVRDFHGVPATSFGHSGVLTVGIKEHTAFPEIKSDEVEHLHGLEVSIVTTATRSEERRVGKECRL